MKKKSLLDYYPVRLNLSEFAVSQSHTSKEFDKIYVEQSAILVIFRYIIKISPLILMLRRSVKKLRGHSAI
jgi:hypothetical protein